MKNILACLNVLTPKDISKLEDMSSWSEGFDKEVLDYCLSTYKEKGVFPTIEFINKRFTELVLGTCDLEIKERISQYLDLLYDTRKTDFLRKSLLKASSKNKISEKDIQDIVSKCVADKYECVFAAQDRLDVRAIYTDIKSRPVGCKFFINMLDDSVVGVSYGKICTIMGFVSHYKTSLARSIAYHNARDLGYNFAIISLEGQKEELYLDLLAMHSTYLKPQSPISSKAIKKGLLSKEDEVFLYEVEESYKAIKGRIHILDAYDIMDGTKVTPGSILAALDKINTPTKIDALIFDYIQLFGNYNVEGAKSIDERRNAIVEMITQLAIHYNAPQGLIVFLLSQTNREGWRVAARNNGKYTLKGLSEINMLERASYYVVALFTNAVLEASNELSIQLLKHRGGEKIEEPFTTFVDPKLGLIGDIEGYGQIFSEDLLDDEDIFQNIDI